MFKRIGDFLNINTLTKTHSRLHGSLFLHALPIGNTVNATANSEFWFQRRFLPNISSRQGSLDNGRGRPSLAAVRIDSASLDDRALGRVRPASPSSVPSLLPPWVPVSRAFHWLQMSGKEGKGSRGSRRSPGKKGDGPIKKAESDNKDKGKRKWIRSTQNSWTYIFI